ncbi:girdin isoform X2 [Salmo salar]|uniref:Girdin isoform X2 n=1 Tax=Salmo salar TaxID=8030 RepID=A0ABM3CKM8_SALSA|nr:girdin-like isoform X2 [Salmo salar]
MESEVFLPHLEQFMLSPLVIWVKTFGQNDGNMTLDYSELLDGVVLNKIMIQINPKATLQSVNKVNNDPSQRILNLTVLIRQIKTYYLETLRQLIMMPLPNVLVLGKTPHSEQSLEEMKKLLLLLLGCAVQCEKKEEYVERIQTLDFDTKAAIAAHIQEVTHSQDSVLDLHWLEASELCAEDLETLFRRLVDQRDTQLDTILELMQERESTPSPSPPSAQSPSDCPSMQQQAASHQHLSVELADSKAKVRRLRQELEEKSEQVLDCRQELENMEAEFKRIQQENSVLLAEARSARTYRDELDALRERAIRADKLESEVGRYREKLHNMEFYKAKVEELKEDNSVLLETKAVLQQQLEGWRARSDKLHQLEKHSLLLNARVHVMEQEKEVDRRRMEELQEENLALELAQRRSMEESQHLGWELEQLSRTPDNPQGQKSLGEEVVDGTRSRLLRLERENQSLLRTIEELRAADLSLGPQHNHNREHTRRDGQRPANTAEVVREYLGSLDNTSWEQSELVIKEDCDIDIDTSHHRDPKCNGVSVDLEGEIDRLERESETLKEKMDLQKQEKGQLEDRESCDLSDRMADLEAVAKDNTRNLLQPGASVSLTRDTSPCSKNKSPRRENSSTGLQTRASSSSTKHTERLEAKCRALDTENQRLQAALDNTGRKLQRLEAEVHELEAENQILQAGLEELRISSRRMEQLEQEKQTLEQEASGLERDKRRLEKENRRLRQQAEIQDSTLDGSNLRVASLERENRGMGKEVERLKEVEERVKGLERDNRELAKQGAINQRALVTLREELVSDKLKTQQRENELERLAHELEMRVRNQDTSPPSDEETPDNRFKMLESELESSLKRSLQIKEDKMAAVEARLQESSTLNQQLRQELKTVRLNYEALLQREEEEHAARSPTPQRESDRAVSEWQWESQEATRELLRVKDRLIEVERNNATLQAERQALQAQLRQLETQSDSLQAQILALQRQTASLQENNTALQTHNANLQVEKSTLNSQSASLLAQNAQLQCQQSSTESDKEVAMREREELRGVYDQLLRDHERLAALHERQAMDYEALMGKHGCLKNVHRTLELEHRTLEDRYKTLLQQKAKLEGLEKALREEQDKMSVEKEQHRTTASECRQLRDEKDWLNQTYRQLLKDQEELQADHKNMKTLLNSTKLEQTKLESDFNKLREQYQQLDITNTKLTNQCELLSQLKGNLEEENRHLLDQIQTLMLQNRTLLEQTMESKDLFHVEQRQHIDKLNELRRQKEKLEEKIMDQYKFYDPSPPRRRGNWIALKMRKLMKPRSRERCGPASSSDHHRSLTPTRSGSFEALPPTSPSASGCQDNGSFVGSDGSGGSTTSPRRSSTLNDLDKLNDLVYPSTLSEDPEQLEESEIKNDRFRKESMTSSMSDSILSIINHQHQPTTTPLFYPTTTAAAAATDSNELCLTDKDYNDSAVATEFDDGDELQNHGLNGVPSRAQSQSSGEFSLSLDNEPWSNGSSPVQPPPSSRRSSSSCLPPSDTSTPRHTRQNLSPTTHTQQRSTSSTHTSSNKHRESVGVKNSSPIAIANTQGSVPCRGREVGSTQDPWPRRSVLRRCTSSSRAPQRPSDGNVPKTAQGQVAVLSRSGLGLNKAPETTTTRASAMSPITVLYVQGKSSSVSGCLNCFSTPLGKEARLREPWSPTSLPRASSVISTAEGSSRRSSVNSDSRVMAKVDPLPIMESDGSPNQETDTINQNQNKQNNPEELESDNQPPPSKPPRDPAIATDRPKSTCQESLFGGTPFNLDSVFSDTIFSELVVTTTTSNNSNNNDKNQTFLCLNPELERNVSFPPLRQESTNGTAPGRMDNVQSQNGGHEDCESDTVEIDC